MNAVGISTTNPANLQNLLELQDKDSAEARKKSRVQRENHYRKNIGLLENHIGELRKQQKNSWKAALFGFFVKLFSQAIKALDFLVPGLGTIVSKVASTLGSLNPFQHKAQNAAVKAKEFEQMAKIEGNQYEKYKNRTQDEEQHRNRMIQRIEKAVDDLQKAKEATVRV